MGNIDRCFTRWAQFAATTALQKPASMAEPRLTTFGDHAVASITDSPANNPTQILTGSSVAAAVASSAAAAAWFHNPTASAHEIMDALYNSGGDVNRTADFCIGEQPCPQTAVRRVTICEAVNKACSDLGDGSCPIFDCDAPDTILPAIAEDEIVELFNVTPGVRVESILPLATQTLIDECRNGYTLHTIDSSVVDNPCPQLQYFGAQATPWTDGQPEDQFCPTCTDTYHSPGVLYVDIDSTLIGTLDDITLICGANAFRIPGQLSANSKLVITDIPEGCEFEQVTLAYSLDNGSGSLASLGSPTLLLPDRDDDDIQDGADNCVDYPNPEQLDTDGDGFGNLCDADFDNNCNTTFLDYFLLTEEFPGSDPNLDITGDGIVNFFDIARFPDLNGQPPGPSGFSSSCDSLH